MKNLLTIQLLLVIHVCFFIGTGSTHRRKVKSAQGVEIPGNSEHILCENEDNTAPMHCFCDSKSPNNATKAECVVFADVPHENLVWTLFNTQTNLNRIIITCRPDKNLFFVPTTALKHLRKLQFLEIKYASIPDIHPYAFANRSELREIKMSRNKIESLSKFAFAYLHSLETLTLDENRIAEIITDTFVALPRLHKLFITQNNLTLLHDGCFQELGALQELELDRNSLALLSRDTFAGLGALKRLDLNNNRIVRLNNYVFAELWSLETLSLENNEIKMISERTFDGLSQLKRLSLRGNRLNSFSDGFLDGVPVLINLDLRDNQLQTLTYENVRPLLPALRNQSSYLFVERNKFICDCRLNWVYRLRNETRNIQVRSILDEMKCLIETKEKIISPGNLDEAGNAIDHAASIGDYGNIDPDTASYEVDDADKFGNKFDDIYGDESGPNEANGGVASSRRSNVFIDYRRLLSIPIDELPCPSLEGPTGAPNTVIITPAGAFFSHATSIWKTSEHIFAMTISTLIVSRYFPF